jgi:hypothetical protein
MLQTWQARRDMLVSLRLVRPTKHMPDTFISYSNSDEKLANFVKSELGRHGLDVFAASASLRPGDHWATSTLTALSQSQWVVVLASRAAAGSAYVNQEIGVALGGAKVLVPVVWDIPPSELPGWLRGKQAVDLRGQTSVEGIQVEIAKLAGRVQAQKQRAALVLGAVVFGLLFLGAKS